jgi:hypothetical protein
MVDKNENTIFDKLKEKTKDKIVEGLIALLLLPPLIIWWVIPSELREIATDTTPKKLLWATGLTLIQLILILLAYIYNLRKKLKQLTDWDLEKSKYQLKAISHQVWAYELKSDTGEHQPWYCPNCFEKKEKSILPKGESNHIGTIYSCSNCNMKLIKPRESDLPTTTMNQIK